MLALAAAIPVAGLVQTALHTTPGVRSRPKIRSTNQEQRRRSIVSFGIYLAGYLIVIAGLTYGAVLMHVPAHWIAVGAIVLVGVGLVTGLKATRQKDSNWVRQ
jgi:cadmium resistance protein CadD (predicted permease)